MLNPTYRFGTFRLHPARRELHDAGRPVALSTSALDVLAYLIANADRAVGRDELMAAVWGRADVTDTVLGQTVLKARRALGDDGQQQTAIQTVPRFGYRWVAPFTVEEHGGVDVVESAPAIDATVADGAAMAEPTPIASISPDSDTLDAPSPAPIGRDVSPRRTLPRSWLAYASLTAILLTALLAFGIAQWQPPDSQGETESPAARSDALVMPAEITADAQWQWLRLGLMDLVAGRLREGGIAILPSETVVGALGGQGDAAREAELLRFAAHVYRPQVTQTESGWQVRIAAPANDAAGSGQAGSDRDWVVNAEAADPVIAARRAADLLLVRLGRTPPPVDSNELDELLHRSRAAMLSDQPELAQRLLDESSPAVRARPEVLHRRAQIALRQGDYSRVEALIEPALPALEANSRHGVRARLLVTLAAAQLRQRQIEDAKKNYGAAADLLADGSDPSTRGTALLGRGAAFAVDDRLDAAIVDLGRARSELQSANDALGLAQVDLNLAQIARMRHRPADALPMLEDARARFQALGSREEAAFATVSLAEVHSDLLDHRAALAMTDTLWPPEREVGNARMRLTLTVTRARALANQGRQLEAEHLIDVVRRDADEKLDRSARAKAEMLALRLAAERGDLAATEAQAARIAETDLAGVDACGFAHAQSLRIGLLQRSGGDAALIAAQAGEQLRRWASDWQGQACVELPLRLAEANLAAVGWPETREIYAEALRESERYGIPDLMVDVAFHYVQQLVQHGDLETAEAVSGRISPWTELDFRAAFTQALVYEARGRDAAWRQARATTQRLAGERLVAAAGLPVVSSRP
jgi:DNA-binding winged helix-turn-helix (wHTH) protein/tetratricopeptide (TPR) repeat protein